MSENQGERADSVRLQMYSSAVGMHREDRFLHSTTTCSTTVCALGNRTVQPRVSGFFWCIPVHPSSLSDAKRYSERFNIPRRQSCTKQGSPQPEEWTDISPGSATVMHDATRAPILCLLHCTELKRHLVRLRAPQLSPLRAVIPRIPTRLTPAHSQRGLPRGEL